MKSLRLKLKEQENSSKGNSKLKMLEVNPTAAVEE
jgi:hypothetical protein